MTFFWIFVWLLNDTPEVHAWNNWAIALALCLAIDIMNRKALL